MLPPIDISYIADRLSEVGEEVQRVFEETSDTPDPSPQVLLGGLQRLLDILRAAERDTLAASAATLKDLTGSDPESLLDHGLDLLSQCSQLAKRLGLPQQARAIQILTLPLCCWMLRRGAEILRPEPVIDAAALLANQSSDPEELAELFVLMTELMNGIGLERALEFEASNSGRPWRVLLFNRAIVATRTHQTVLMEAAFDAIGEHLPSDAPDFFREGMGQMEMHDYPAHVRQVMQRYFERWCSGQRLH
ncbi:hypothetical protein [Imhoffiella purpurea]|nr:hypothetical protein [Imhoffiella purpurea]